MTETPAQTTAATVAFVVILGLAYVAIFIAYPALVG